MSRAWEWLGQWLGMLPGRLESPGQVKRRMLVISIVAGLALGGLYVITLPGTTGPFSQDQLQDMSGLPVPPVRYVQEPDGTYRELSPDELQQLRELQELIRNFPAPQNFGGGTAPIAPPNPNPEDTTEQENGG